MNSFGNNIKLTIFGASHAASLGCEIAGLPAGKRIDMRRVGNALLRRSASKGGLGATARREEDKPLLSGGFSIVEGTETSPAVILTDGGDIRAEFKNGSVRRRDYSGVARPSHADYAAYKKYGPAYDLSGGGMSSGRMTLPLVFAGAVCAQLLEERGIFTFSHVLRIGSVSDKRYDPVRPQNQADTDEFFPLADSSVRTAMEEELQMAKHAGDTLSCECECAVTGLPAGLGEPFFDGLESMLAHMLFSIPGLRGVEFGEMEHIRGSEMNDRFTENGATATNRSGGVNGGMANGMPLVFRTWFRPVPSISLPQQGYDLALERPVELCITGRHDTCILPRGCAVVEAAANICIYDLLRCVHER